MTPPAVKKSLVRARTVLAIIFFAALGISGLTLISVIADRSDETKVAQILQTLEKLHYANAPTITTLPSLDLLALESRITGLSVVVTFSRWVFWIAILIQALTLVIAFLLTHDDERKFSLEKTRPQTVEDKKQAVPALLMFVPMLAFHLLNGLFLPPLSATPLAFWSVDFLGAVLLPTLCILMLAKRYKFSAGDFGFANSNPLDPAAITIMRDVLITFVVFGAYFVSVQIFDAFTSGWSFHNVIPTDSTRPLVVIYLALSAGFFEEIFYRALLWKATMPINNPSLRISAYVLGSSTMFSLIHWESGAASMLATFGASIVWSLCFAKTKSIRSIIIGHALADLAVYW